MNQNNYKSIPWSTRFSNTVLTVVIFWLAWIGIRVLISALGVLLIPERNIFNVRHQLELNIPYLLQIWGNFDGVNYLRVAMQGYTQAELGFFPFYPILISFFSDITLIPVFYVGLSISLISILGTLYIISLLLKLDDVKIPLWFMLTLILVYPTAYYYGAIYNDSLFFLLSTSALYLGRKRKWLFASIIGFFACMTRLNGLGIIFFLAVEWFSQRDNTKIWIPRSIFTVRAWVTFLREKWYVPVLVIAGFLAYLAFIHVRFESWHMLFMSMRQWGQSKATFPVHVFLRYVKFLYLSSWHTFAYWIAVLELFSVLLYIYMLMYTIKKIRFSYWILLLVTFVIPTITGTFQGMPRYSLHMYPFFLCLATFLYAMDKKKRMVALILFFVLQCVLLMFYTRGYFIS